MTNSAKAIYKIGDKVAACYDGKWCRAKKATVIKVFEDVVTVSFVPWTTEENLVELVCKYDEENDNWGGWLTGVGEVGILRSLGCQGDWYSLVPVNLLEESGYEVK